MPTLLSFFDVLFRSVDSARTQTPRSVKQQQVPPQRQDDGGDASLRRRRDGTLLRGAPDVRLEGLLRRLVSDHAAHLRA